MNFSQDQLYKIHFHSHQEAELFYFHHGKCTYLIGDKIIHLSAGDLILMNGLTLHRPKLFEGHPYVRSTIHFNQSYFKKLLQPMGMEKLVDPFSTLSSIHLSFSGDDRTKLESYLSDMNECKKEDSSISTFRYQLLFMDLLSFIFPYCTESLQDTVLPQTEKEWHVQNVIKFIENHYQTQFHLEALGEELHVSKYYLSKIFKEVTGVTIFKYLHQKRVNQAKVSLMLNESISITELSYQSGFKYPSHFSRVFKQLTGFTPEQYRKQLVN
ncbi:AraC-like DNA-binding protein [Alkalicoccobacillus murimartini]|uniref:AraC-like DNA-binding protein n=2 Tax=Alkalicoccobacillus murimartini TaxID=171685 RepID=A0ABT9YJV8_9BACI|nr:AraC-like DNA-binding protein [Alkalicoccobacillus murimartini]